MNFPSTCGPIGPAASWPVRPFGPPSLLPPSARRSSAASSSSHVAAAWMPPPSSPAPWSANGHAPITLPPLQSTIVTTPSLQVTATKKALIYHCHVPFPSAPSAPIKGEGPIIIHRTSFHYLSIVPAIKHRPHQAPPPPLLCHHHSVVTPPPSPR
jgi:hypothetical protein